MWRPEEGATVVLQGKKPIESEDDCHFKADKWTWALGGQAGKVTKFGNQPVKLFEEVLYNPEDDNGPTSEWTAKVGLTFLFQK